MDYLFLVNVVIQRFVQNYGLFRMIYKLYLV